jgi:hypothetical protein
MKQEVAQAQDELNTTKRQKNDLLYRGEQEQRNLEGKQAEQQQVVNTLQKEQKTIQSLIDEQKKKDAALNAQIEKLIAEEVARAKARAEAEARAEAQRKAAEEAARKRAAEAKKRADELARKKAAAEAAAALVDILLHEEAFASGEAGHGAQLLLLPRGDGFAHDLKAFAHALIERLLLLVHGLGLVAQHELADLEPAFLRGAHQLLNGLIFKHPVPSLPSCVTAAGSAARW